MQNLDIDSIQIDSDFEIDAQDANRLDMTGGAEIYKEQVGGTRDCEKLENLPTLNGKVIIGDMYEEDPNVDVIPIDELSDLF